LTFHALSEPLFLPFTHRAFYFGAPEIEVEIAATSPQGVLQGQGSLTTLMRLDSGASTTVISDVYARHFGIDLVQFPLEEVDVSAGSVVGRLALLDVYFCGQWFEVPAVFAPIWPQFLGREGIFDNASVAFSYQDLGINPFVAMARL
jgi:hypothetical protein